MTSLATTISVKVGDLCPGSFGDIEPNFYFPDFTWKVYCDTFKMLDKQPETFGYLWELRKLWTPFCEHRFGYEPTGGETVDEGRGWAWPNIESDFRRLHASYKLHGYKPDLITNGEEFIVAINADGRMCMLQGNKRVALLRKYKEMSYEIDITITQQAPEWLAIKEGIRNASGGKEVCYQPMSHPDLKDWQVSQPCKERLLMMVGYHLPGNTLDIGCHTGWFCRHLKDSSNRVVGVEENAGLIQAAKIRDTWRYQNPPKQPEYINSSIEAYLDENLEQFDTCLYLSIIMHAFDRLGHEGAWKQLLQVSQRCKRMYMDIVFGGYSQYFPFTPETMANEIISHTEFTESKLLGRTKHENRPFYVFTK